MGNRASWAHVDLSDHLCECGCGERTPLIQKTDRARGRIKGEPFRFIQGHRVRVKLGRVPRVDPNPDGFCHCGCGNRTSFDGEVHQLYFRSHKFWDDAHDEYSVNPVTGCWLWRRAVEKSGYGRKYFGGRKSVPAHRWVWEQYVGPVPEGVEFHHLCETRRCVNPEHMHPMTRDEHVLTHLRAA